MGLFDRFIKREEPTPEVTPPVDDVLLKALLEGETITREKAMTLPAVSGAVDMISSSIASMPVKLYKVKQGKVEEVDGDPRVRLLNGDTGDTLDAFQMKKAMVEDYLMGKGGYCYIQKQRNEVTGLFYVEDRYITIWKTYSPIHKQYQIFVNGFDEAGREKNAGKFKPYDFIKLLRNTKDGASGVGLTVEISKELETAYQTLIYQLGMVKAGGNKRGFLKANRKLGQEEINALKTAWRNLYGNNTENVVVLNNGLEFQEASNSSVEMQLNESKRTLQEEINNLFHISNDFDMTFKLAIYPIVKAFETALNRDLLLEKEKKNYFFEFDVKEIIRANIRERYESYKLAKETGFMTINEIRRAENLNWIDGMDVVNVGLGAVLYDTNIGKYFTPNTGETTDITEGSENAMLEGHELEEAYDESGNSAERDIIQRYNDAHDDAGRFASKSGGSVGGGISSLANSQTWEDFKGNMRDRDKVQEMKEMGIKSPKAMREYWVEQKMKGFTENDAKEITEEKAIDIIQKNIGQNVLDGWFRNADSDYKEKLETAILENKEVRNAGLNIAFKNWKDSTGDTETSFKDYVNTTVPMYRGEHGQETLSKDVFKSYTTDRNVALSFGNDVSEINVRPIDTLGSYQTTAESEYLVPVSLINNK